MGAAVRTLLEREAELRRFEELIEAAAGGSGSVAAIEGVAGIGKTELLAVVRERGSAAGIRVLAARGGELERDVAFGIARQLLERVVLEAPDDEQVALLAGAADLARGALGLGEGRTASSDAFAVHHGLYWLCSNLCDGGPVMLAVDDAHWGDLQSLRWLVYLARRVEHLPMLMVLAARPHEGGIAQETIQAMLVEGTAELLPLAPLGSGAVGQVVRGRFVRAEAGFCDACHGASGGNPLLLRELLVAMDGGGMTGAAREADRVESFASSGVSRYVHARLARLGEAAVRLARAVAVLGAGGTRLRRAAGLAGLQLEDAAGIADELRAADILHAGPALEFVHPLVRAAVYGEIGPSARSEAHAAAARLVSADGAEVEHVAAHLLAAEPRGDEWAVEQLRKAAQRSLEAGAPDAAATLLERALAEPAPEGERIELLTECGAAASRVDPSAAVERFTDALALASEPEQRAAIVIPLAKALCFSDRMGDAVAVLATVLGELEQADEDLVRLVETEWLMWGHFWLDNPERAAQARRLREMAGGLPGDSLSQRKALGLLAWDLVAGDTPVGETLAVVGRSLGPGPLFTDPVIGFEIPTLVSATYMFCDELDRAFELYDRGVEEMREVGWLVHLTFTYGHRGHVRLRQGALLDAEADAKTGWELAGQLGPTYPPWWYAFANLVQVLVARGSVDEAQELVDATGVGDASPNAVIFPHPRVVRGELYAARGDHEHAVAELMDAGTVMEECGYLNPAWNPWRIHVTPSLAALGRVDEARELIAQAVVLARRVGASLALGAALRTAAGVQSGDDALALLTESIRLLERSPGRLEHARSLAAFGAALRRAGRRAESREPLRDALELAHRCGAVGLAAQAREELEATGARPRSVVRTGVDALTPSERRVCQLAVKGHSNPEIAQALFVSRRTVESHLASAYRKLDIRSRGELGGALVG
jgi:DNA-binding CsgD family transcriptional regulator